MKNHRYQSAYWIRGFRCIADLASNTIFAMRLIGPRTRTYLDSPDFETVDAKWAATIRRESRCGQPFKTSLPITILSAITEAWPTE